MASKSNSFWLKDGDERYQQYSSTTVAPTHANIVIIGGGITGISISYWLKKLGVADVVVLERNVGITEGATGRNGGHLWPSLQVPAPELVEKYGWDEMRRLFAFERETVSLVRNFIETHPGVAEYVQFHHTGGLDVVKKQEEADALKEAVSILHSQRLAPEVEYWDTEKVQKATFSPHYQGGVFQPLACQLWPARLVGCIAHQSLKMGTLLYTETPVVLVNENHSSSSYPIEIQVNGPHAPKGNIIRANKVIYATNAYSADILPQLKDIVIPTRGQIVCTSPVTAFQFPHSVAQYDHEYMIQRRSDRKIICGGMRWVTPTQELNETNDREVSPMVGAALREYLLSTFPALKEQKDFCIETEWTGIMGFTPDSKPLVGPLPIIGDANNRSQSSNQWLALGFTGHGMPNAFGVAKCVAEIISGKQSLNYLPKPFSPQRFDALTKGTSDSKQSKPSAFKPLSPSAIVSVTPQARL